MSSEADLRCSRWGTRSAWSRSAGRPACRGAAPAQAQLRRAPIASIDMQLWQPAIGPQQLPHRRRAPRCPEHMLLWLGAGAPPTSATRTRSTRRATNQMEANVEVVHDQVTSELSAAMGIVRPATSGLALPFTLYLDGDEFNEMGMATGYRLTESGIGDLRLEGKTWSARFGRTRNTRWPCRRADAADGQPAAVHRRQERHRPDPGATELRLGQAARGGQAGHPAAAGVEELRGRGRAPAAVRRRRRPTRSTRASRCCEIFGRSGLAEFAQLYADVNPFEVDAGMRWRCPSW